MANIQLYKLTERYQTIENMLDDEYITRESIEETIANIKEQIEDKVESIGKLVLTLKASISSIQTEEERLAKRKQAMTNHMEWLKLYLLNEMTATNTLKVKRDVITVSVSDNPPSVEIVDEELIPDIFRKVIPETWQVDKRAIIEHFKQTGEIVSGADIILNKKHVNIR